MYTLVWISARYCILIFSKSSGFTLALVVPYLFTRPILFNSLFPISLDISIRPPFLASIRCHHSYCIANDDFSVYYSTIFPHCFNQKTNLGLQMVTDQQGSSPALTWQLLYCSRASLFTSLQLGFEIKILIFPASNSASFKSG